MVRKIILLSDGTGNSSARIWRTNVWRTFQALDLSGSDQVAAYDDGVGASSFKPWAILGGAFGFGLKRNVIDLYKFACRNYRDSTDEIFGFGFSRGAFTIRVVVGLMLDQGLIDPHTINERQLDKLSHLAYRTYRRAHFYTNWRLMLHAIQSLFRLKTPAAQARVQIGTVNAPRIRFLGLWDTVAAYGLPIDEMTLGFSQWIWPLEIPNHTPHPSIQRACHAISLDDERTTARLFTPCFGTNASKPQGRTCHGTPKMSASARYTRTLVEVIQTTPWRRFRFTGSWKRPEHAGWNSNNCPLPIPTR
jgi:hypothetical protein